MAIDFSRVNVTLKQFQKISSGDYNAGEIRLTGQNSLGKVNNHVYKRDKNIVSLSHEEVLAVKDAFVKALRSSGVSQDEIASVRRELGLAPMEGGAIDRTLGERSLKPMTRQQVREILDRYAQVINIRAGNPRIRTSQEQNARLSDAERNDRAARRQEVNDSLQGSRTVSTNHDVLLFERLVAGDLNGIYKEDADRMAEMARQKLAIARERYGDNPPANDTLRVSWQLPSGQSVEIGAPGSTAEFVRYLEDTLFFLSIPRPERGNAAAQQPPPPPITNAEWNDELKSALLSDVPAPLPREIAALEKELLDSARVKFGEAVIPRNIRLRDIISGPIGVEFNRAVAAAGNRRLGADDLRMRFINALNSYAAMTLAGERLEQAAAARGIRNISIADKRGFINRNPALLGAIAGAGSPEAVAQVLDNAVETVNKMVGLLAKIRSVQKAAGERAAAVIAGKCNLPAAVLTTLPSLKKFVTKQVAALATKLVAAKDVVCETDQDVDNAFEDLIAKFADSFADCLAKTNAVIARKNLSPVAANSLRQMVISRDSFNPDVFDTEKIANLENMLKADFPPEARMHAEDAYNKAGAEPWKADALIVAAMGACGDDPELRSMVLEKLDSILVGSNARLRSADSVRNIVERLKANLAELRRLAAHDPGLLADGLELLRGMASKPLPAGLFGRVVQSVWEQPLGALRGLSARSRGIAIHKAIVQFERNISRVGKESGLTESLYGPDEIALARDFIVRRMLSSLQRADIEGLRAALHSQNCSKLIAAYGEAQNLVEDQDLSEGLTDAVGNVSGQLRMQVFEFNVSLCRHLGIEEDAPEVFEDPLPRLSSFGAAGLENELVQLARERLAAEKKETVDKYVKGNGAASERLRAVFDDTLGEEPLSPGATINSRFQDIANTMVNISVMTDMKNFATGKKTQFDEDRHRGFEITLGGVGQVSTDPAVARDQFAKFITKNPAATYASLTPQERNKANFAMSLASQGTGSAAIASFGVMLDPDQRDPLVQFSGNPVERSLEMQLDAEGGFSVKYHSKTNVTHAIFGLDPVPCAQGSNHTADLDIHVDPDEMERIGNIRAEDFNDRPIVQIINTERPEHKYSVAKNAIPQQFRLRLDVGPTFIADLK